MYIFQLHDSLSAPMIYRERGGTNHSPGNTQYHAAIPSAPIDMSRLYQKKKRISPTCRPDTYVEVFGIFFLLINTYTPWMWASRRTKREYMDDDGGPIDEQTKVYKDGNMLLDLQFCTHIPSYEMVKYYYLFRIVKMFEKNRTIVLVFV